MGKGKSRRSDVIKTITTTTEKVIPVVDKSLSTVGTTAKNVATASVPVIEKGVSVVYGTMATGLDLGTKGVKTLAKGISRNRYARRHKSRSHKISGGRRTRHRRTRHRRRY
jgi:transposase